MKDNQNDNLALGILLAIGVMVTYSIALLNLMGIVSNGAGGDHLILIFQGVMAIVTIAIPVVLYIKGLRKSMKAYLATLILPLLLLFLLFGSCLLMIGQI